MRHDSLSPVLAGKRIVLIADGSLVRLLFRKYLSLTGLIVVGEAVTIPEGIEMVRQEQPELILLDLPNTEEEGITAIHLVRKESTALVAVIAPYPQEGHQRQTLEAGACSYLVKPVMPGDLIAALENCCSAGK